MCALGPCLLSHAGLCADPEAGGLPVLLDSQHVALWWHLAEPEETQLTVANSRHLQGTRTQASVGA